MKVELTEKMKGKGLKGYLDIKIDGEETIKLGFMIDKKTMNQTAVDYIRFAFKQMEYDLYCNLEEMEYAKKVKEEKNDKHKDEN